MGGAKVLLVMMVMGLVNVECVNWNPVPRKTIRYHGEFFMIRRKSLFLHVEWTCMLLADSLLVLRARVNSLQLVS